MKFLKGVFPNEENVTSVCHPQNLVLGLLSRNASSICPMYIVASAGASLVPSASPNFFMKSRWSKLNMSLSSV